MKNQETKKNRMTNLLMILSTLIFASTSLITVFISMRSWQEEKEMLRPYLVFHKSPVVEFTIPNRLAFYFYLKNSGEHPAAKLRCQTTIFACNSNESPLLIDQMMLGDFLSANDETTLSVETVTSEQKEDISSYYLVLDLKYHDPILDIEHEQIFYLLWPGSSKKELHSIYHASQEDKELILQYLREV